MFDALEMTIKPVSPLEGLEFSTRSGSTQMRPVEDCTRLSLRISGEHLEKAAKAFGQDIPARIGVMSSGDGRFALCLGPDEWLLLAPAEGAPQILAQFAKMDTSVLYSLVDVSHRSVGIEISGPEAQLMLNSGCPLDLDNLAVGDCARTLLDKAEIVLMKLDHAHYRLEVARSFAQFTWDFLTV